MRNAEICDMSGITSVVHISPVYLTNNTAVLTFSAAVSIDIYDSQDDIKSCRWLLINLYFLLIFADLS